MIFFLFVDNDMIFYILLLIDSVDMFVCCMRIGDISRRRFMMIFDYTLFVDL